MFLFKKTIDFGQIFGLNHVQNVPTKTCHWFLQTYYIGGGNFDVVCDVVRVKNDVVGDYYDAKGSQSLVYYGYCIVFIIICKCTFFKGSKQSTAFKDLALATL